MAPKGIGKRSTSLKSRMYNHDLLTEVHFWKEFLTNSSPRWQLNFGDQELVVDGTLMSTKLEWPGVPDDAQPFSNTETEDDLFTSAAFYRALDQGAVQDVEVDELELDDLNALEAEAEDDALFDEDFVGDSTIVDPSRPSISGGDA